MCLALGPRRRQYASVVIVLLGCASVSASTLIASAGDLAQLTLDDLLRVEVRSASRYAQPLADSPASVSVIERDELRQQGYRNLAEALSTVRGVYLSNDRNYTYIGVRGFNRPGDYNARVLLLTDGARRNDALYDQAHVGNESPIEVNWIKRLEFVSGPASAVYGANALFGIVNTVLLDGGDVDGVRVTAETGSGHSGRVGLVAGRRINADSDWFVGLAAYGARGADLYLPAFDNGQTTGWARGLDGEQYQKAYGKLRLGNWRLTGNLSSRDKDLPNAPYSTVFGQPGTRTLDQHALLELAFDGQLSQGWQQQFRVFNGSYRYNGDYKYADQLDNRDHGRATWRGADYRLIMTGVPDHKLLVGLETQWNTQLKQVNFDVSPAAVYLDVDRPSHAFGLVAQDEWRFHAQWLLSAGLRYDKHQDFSAIASPRAALIYQPGDHATLKAMVSKAYRPPNAFERFYDDGGIIQKANSALVPERMRSVELTGDFRIGQGARMGVTVFRNVMHNMIDQVMDAADGLYMFSNQSEVRARGLEIDAERRWAGGQRLRGSVSWQRSRLADGSELVNSPARLAKLVWATPLGAGWMGSGEWQGSSARHTLNGRVSGFGTLGLTLTSPRLGGLGELSLSIYNLADRRYSDPASSAFATDALVQDGRQFRLRWVMSL